MERKKIENDLESVDRRHIVEKRSAWVRRSRKSIRVAPHRLKVLKVNSFFCSSGGKHPNACDLDLNSGIYFLAYASDTVVAASIDDKKR